jgi:hypothetical protein
MVVVRFDVSTSTYRLVRLILLPLEPYARGYAVWCVRLTAWVVQGICTHSLCSRFARLQVVLRLDRQSRRVGSTAYLTPPRAVRSGVSSSRRLGRARRLHVFVPAFCSTSCGRRRRLVVRGMVMLVVLVELEVLVLGLVVVLGDGGMAEVAPAVSSLRSACTDRVRRRWSSIVLARSFGIPPPHSSWSPRPLDLPGHLWPGLWPLPFDFVRRRLHTTCSQRRHSRRPRSASLRLCTTSPDRRYSPRPRRHHLRPPCGSWPFLGPLRSTSRLAASILAAWWSTRLVVVPGAWLLRQRGRSTAYHSSPPRATRSGVVCFRLEVVGRGREMVGPVWVRRTRGGRPRPHRRRSSWEPRSHSPFRPSHPLLDLPPLLDSFVDSVRRFVRRAHWHCWPCAVCVRVRGVSGLVVDGRLTCRLGLLGLDVGVVDVYVLAVFVDCFPAPSTPRLYSPPAPLDVFTCTTRLDTRYVAVFDFVGESVALTWVPSARIAGWG